MVALAVDTHQEWSFKNCRSILAFCLLKQIVREFEQSCEKVLGSDAESDGEIEFLVETLKSLMPQGKKFLDQRFKKDDYIHSETLSQMFDIAEHCINEPVKALEFSIHNSLNYFLEDCGEMEDLEPYEVKVKILRFFFPEINIPEDNLESFFHGVARKFKQEETKSLEGLYLDRICLFVNDFVELRYLTHF